MARTDRDGLGGLDDDGPDHDGVDDDDLDEDGEGEKGPRPGDGSALPRLHWWQVLTRTSASVPLEESDGEHHEYAFYLDFFADREEVALYRDGVQVQVAPRPARFEVPGGRIEIATSLYGMQRAHLVRPDGSARVMRFAPNSAEWWRARFGRRFPRVSRLIGWLAIAVLLLGVALAVPQLLELISGTDIGGRLGLDFTSPVSLPAWANTSLLVGGILASTERALTVRNHWLVDAETWVADL